MKSDNSARKYGFSYIELLLSLVFFFHLFVLFHQIFYNIKSETELMNQFKTLEIERIVLKIERDLKETTIYLIEDNLFYYIIGSTKYSYYVEDNCFILKIDDKTWILLEEVEAVNFSLKGYLLHLSITNNKGKIYENIVIIYK